MRMIPTKYWFSLLILISLVGGLYGCRPDLPLPETPTPTEIPQPTATLIPPTPTPVTEPAVLVNPGFEEKSENGVISGWAVSGAEDAVLIEDRGHSGNFRLTHTAANSFVVDSSQSVSGLGNQWYTLSAWVRSSGGNEAYLALTCGGQEKRVYIPATTPGYRWLHLVVSNQVQNGQCTINLHTFGKADSWVSFDDISLTPGQIALNDLGADISSLNKSEVMGGLYYYQDGTQGDALEILKDGGLNYARLRIWVDPVDGYHNKEEILKMALRIKNLGIKLLIDFHYSDNWADPGKQYKPAAWEGYDVEQLTQAVYDHTYDVCSSLAAQGTPADMVQIGNEINAGLLWPEGDYNHFDNMAAFLKAGIQAAKDSNESTKIMLHIAEGGDNDMARWWFDNITRRDVPFDVIGLSYYPFWHGSLTELQSNMNDLSARYDKDVVVAEFAYPFTGLENDKLANIANRRMALDGYLFTPEGQRLMLRDVMAVIRGVNDGRGKGVFYWDATWTAVEGNGWDTTDPNSGNGWENQALFDYQSKALPALKEYLNP